MKVIPQINVFAINIELKVIVGLVMVMLLMNPFSDFRVATATASLLMRTLPFFRSSRRFFGVAFSVLESPATE